MLRKSKNKLKSELISDPKEILKLLSIGINIPILPEFYNYIIHDLEYFKAKSIIIIENQETIGHVLVYNDDGETLFFGFFGIINHDPIKIKYLLKELIEYAIAHNFKIIRGPINIPTIIYGWGFMKEGSKEDLFIAKPVNPPVYQNIFLEKGFFVKFEEATFEGLMVRLNPWKMKKYDYIEYEYFNPKDWDDFIRLKDLFLGLHDEYLPHSVRITPSVNDLSENYGKFIFQYGYNFMFFFVRYKPTGEIIACGCCVPNPFHKDSRGNYDYVHFYSWVVKPEHRRKGIVMFMYGATSLKLWKKKIRYMCGIIGADISASTIGAQKVGTAKNRTHLILEYQL